MNVSNYIITHKKFDLPQVDAYVPVQVGNGKDLGWLRDNSGDNIAEKNANYCELTGIYWIWKNDKDSDVIGISHYRRFFTEKKISRSKFKILSKSRTEKILANYDIILPKKEIYKETVREQYCIDSGFNKDLNLVRNILVKKHNDYVDAFDYIMKVGKIHQFNMMICSKKIFNSYCEWLFSIFFELEQYINLDEYNDYQKRIYGFLSERLLNVWVLKNDLKVKELRVINVGMPYKELIRLNLRRIKNRFIYLKNNGKETKANY